MLQRVAHRTRASQVGNPKAPEVVDRLERRLVLAGHMHTTCTTAFGAVVGCETVSRVTSSRPVRSIATTPLGSFAWSTALSSSILLMATKATYGRDRA